MNPDRRRNLRVPLRVEVQLSGSEARTDYAINLSRSGMCLQTLHASAVGAELRVCFLTGTDGKQISARAEVVWCHTPEQRSEGLRFYEMGLRFVDLSRAERLALEHFVEELTSAWPDA